SHSGNGSDRASLRCQAEDMTYIQVASILRLTQVEAIGMVAGILDRVLILDRAAGVATAVRRYLRQHCARCRADVEAEAAGVVLIVRVVAVIELDLRLRA